MAKKIQNYKKAFLKTFEYTYDGSTVDVYIFGNGPNHLLVYLPVPYIPIILAKYINRYISEKYTIVCIDILTTPQTLSLGQILRVSKKILKSMKIRKYSVIGIQYGAKLAVSLASSTDNIQSLVLINPIFKKSLLNKGQSRSLKRLKKFSAYMIKGYYNFVFFKKGKSLLNTQHFNSKNYLDLFKNTNRESIKKYLKDYYNTDLTLHVSKLIQNRILLVYNKDFEKQAYFLRRISDRRIEEVYIKEGFQKDIIRKQILKFINKN